MSEQVTLTDYWWEDKDLILETKEQGQIRCVNAHVTAIRFEGLESSVDESITLVGNSKRYEPAGVTNVNAT